MRTVKLMTIFALTCLFLSPLGHAQSSDQLSTGLNALSIHIQDFKNMAPTSREVIANSAKEFKDAVKGLSFNIRKSYLEERISLLEAENLLAKLNMVMATAMMTEAKTRVWPRLVSNFFFPQAINTIPLMTSKDALELAYFEFSTPRRGYEHSEADTVRARVGAIARILGLESALNLASVATHEEGNASLAFLFAGGKGNPNFIHDMQFSEWMHKTTEGVLSAGDLETMIPKGSTLVDNDVLQLRYKFLVELYKNGMSESLDSNILVDVAKMNSAHDLAMLVSYMHVKTGKVSNLGDAIKIGNCERELKVETARESLN